jgi:peptide/nickel transport system permease protein
MRSTLARIARLVAVVAAVTFLTTLLTAAVQGDTATVIAPFASADQRADIRHDLHLDEPVVVRYGLWLGDFVQGDLGRIYTGPQTSRSVADEVESRLPTSLQLMVYAQVLALVVAIPLRVATAYRAGSRFDTASNATAFGALAIPSFVVLLLLAYYLGVRLGVCPVTYDRTLSGIGGHLRNYFIPSVSLALGQIAIYMRLLRSDMIATLQEDFVTLARSTGLPPKKILWRQALRPSSLTLLTAAGLNVGALVGGAMVIETVYGLPGIGGALATAIATRQYAALQSYVAVIAIGYVLVNFTVDALYQVLDPRIRRARLAA